MSVPAPLRALYLLAVALGVFWLPPIGVVAVLGLQGVLWAALGLGARRLARQLGKLWFFAALIVLTYAFTTQDATTDRWIAWWGLRLNATGIETGLGMLARILTVVLASQVVRAGDPRALVAGLRGLGMPRTAAASIDTVLALFGDTGRRHGRGGGGGSGGGQRRRHVGDAGSEAGGEGIWAALRRVSRGDVGPIAERLEHQIERARDHVRSQHDDTADAAATDVAVVAGVSLAMLGVRALKALPSIPFAPGHKLVVLTPLYIAASLLTRSRFGSTATGASMGTVSFLMGDGRYGVFEIAKHVVPGVIADLGVPLLASGTRVSGPVVWSLFGGLIGAGRFFTVLAVVWLVQAPAFAYAILVPGLAVHVTFGILSGYVTHHLVQHLSKPEAPRDVGATPSEASR